MKKGIFILVLMGMNGVLLSQVDYDTEIQPIFNSNCTICHGNSGGLNLTSYSNLMAGTSSHGPVVTPFDGSNSVLVQKLGLNPPFGDRMPRNNQTYFDSHQDELQTIIDWINEGALPQANVALEKEQEYPNRPFIYQNYPNPFNPVTTVMYRLPERMGVVVTVYDILGKRIRTLVRRIEEPGLKSVIWDGRDDFGRPVSSGEYLYQISTGDFIQTEKMILLR